MKHIFLSAVIFIACNNSAPTRSEEVSGAAKEKTQAETMSTLERHAGWLIGEWHYVNKEEHFTELWERESDTSFTGFGCFLKGKDTVSSESLRLVQRGDDLLYIPTVKGQNNDRPVVFKLTDTAENQLLFENPAHDFPQKIRYARGSKKYMVIEIIGKTNGKNKMRAYPMIKREII